MGKKYGISCEKNYIYVCDMLIAYDILFYAYCL